jgi:tetratricopeptide (TPR) repeat protein
MTMSAITYPAADQAMRLYFHGEFRQAEAICDEAIAISLANEADLDAIRTRAAVLIAKARVGCEIGLLADNLSMSYQAFDLLDQANDPCLRARGLHSLAAAYYYDNKLAPALAYATQCLELCREENLTDDLVDVLNTRSALCGTLSDYTSALEHSREALALARAGGDATQLIQSLVNHAISQIHLNEYAIAEESLGEGILLAQQENNNFLLATLQCLGGSIKNNQGQFDLAAEALREAVPVLAKFEPHPRLAANYYNLGFALWQTGELEEAEQALTRALVIAETFDWQLILPAIHAMLSAFYASAGDHAKAFSHQSSQTAAQRLATFSQPIGTFPVPSLKYPPSNPSESLLRSVAMRQVRTLDPSTRYLNHFTLVASGRQAYTNFVQKQEPTQLLAIHLNLEKDAATMEPRTFRDWEMKRLIILLGRHFRITDLPCRMPTGQFLLLMPATSLQTAKAIAVNIQTELGALGEDGTFLDHKVIVASLGLEDRSISDFINRTLLQLVEAG